MLEAACIQRVQLDKFREKNGPHGLAITSGRSRPPPPDVHAHPLHVLIIIVLCASVLTRTHHARPEPLTAISGGSAQHVCGSRLRGQTDPLALPTAPPVSTPASGSPLHYLRPCSDHV